jgi:hypothetical protein
MHLVGEEEEKAAQGSSDELKLVESLHSFSPRSYPKDVCPPSEGEEYTKVKSAKNQAEELSALRREKRYLPCHYFDYICGTSTGA